MHLNNFKINVGSNQQHDSLPIVHLKSQCNNSNSDIYRLRVIFEDVTDFFMAFDQQSSVSVLELWGHLL
jgi:hypothetical protein